MKTMEIISKLKEVGLYPSQYDEGYASTINGDYPRRWIDHMDLVQVFNDLIVVNRMYSVYNGKVYSFNWGEMSSNVNAEDALALTRYRDII